MAKKLKVVLVNFNIRTVKKNNYPLAIMLLRSYAYKFKHIRDNVEIIPKEYTSPVDKNKVAKELNSLNPDLLGFSCYVWNFHDTVETAEIFKKNNPKVKLLMGGPEFSPISVEMLKELNFIDLVVRDEGEETFTELLKELLKVKPDLSKIKGITFRSIDKIIKNKSRPQLNSLNSLPLPYDKKLIPIRGREVYLDIQRGCLYRCHFCNYFQNHVGIRKMGLRKIHKYISCLISEAPAAIYLLAPVFNYDLKWAKAICRHIIKVNRKNIPIYAEIKAELMDEELAQLMKKACFGNLEIGLQTTTPKALKDSHRHYEKRKFKKGIDIVLKYNIPVEIQIIAGLPNETNSSFLNTMRNLLSLNTPGFSVLKLMVLPGTHFWKNAKKYGLEFEEKPLHYVIQTKTLSKKDINFLDRLTRIIMILHRMKSMKHLSTELNTSIVDLALKWIEIFGAAHPPLKTKNTDKLYRQTLTFLKTVYRENENINPNFYYAIAREELCSKKSEDLFI